MPAFYSSSSSLCGSLFLNSSSYPACLMSLSMVRASWVSPQEGTIIHQGVLLAAAMYRLSKSVRLACVATMANLLFKLCDGSGSAETSHEQYGRKDVAPEFKSNDGGELQHADGND